MKGQPLPDSEFEALMVSLAPFENAPVVAVGVSGGPDSMALVYLMDRWTRDRGGRAIGLTLDHGLREASSGEAAQVGRWLDQADIEHHTLKWLGEKPTSAIQETARDVRRHMLLSWCREAGILHLALAHHADDQAETYVMRLAHNSGPDGLAGMASVMEARHARIIRPVLGIPKSRLVAVLDARGCSWINDPSNDQMVFERSRVRKALVATAESGAGRAAIGRVVGEYATQRHEMDAITAYIVMRSMTFHAAGYALIDFHGLSASDPLLGTRALSRVLRAVGGRSHAPARDSVAHLYEQLTANCASKPPTVERTWARTLGGCRIISTKDNCLVCREQRNLPDELVVRKSGQIVWDNRFQLDLVTITHQPVLGDVVIRPLGKAGWHELVANAPEIKSCPVPEPVRYSLPALYHNNAIVQVAHLTNPGLKTRPCAIRIAQAQFAPPEPVVGAGFPLA